jgi:hypothetical protein
MLTPATFTARPVQVQAMRYTQANWRALDRWLAAEGVNYEFTADGSHLVIGTLEGDSRDTTSSSGYWIVRGTQGEFYPVSPEAFAAKYGVTR